MNSSVLFLIVNFLILYLDRMSMDTVLEQTEVRQHAILLEPRLIFPFENGMGDASNKCLQPLMDNP